MKFKDNINYILLSLVLVVLPISFNLTSYAIIIWVFIFVFQIKKYNLKSYFQKKNLFFLLFNTFFLLTLLGLVYSQNLSQGLVKLSRNLPFLILPILIFHTIRDIKAIQKVVFLFLLTLFLMCVLCYANAVFKSGMVYPFDDGRQFFYNSPFGRDQYVAIVNGIHPSYFSWFLFFAFTYTIHILPGSKKWTRIVFSLFAFTYLMSSIILGSKIFVLLFLLVFVFNVFKVLFSKTKSSYKWIMGAFFIAVIGISALNKQVRYRIQEEMQNTIAYKKEQWSATLRIIEENFLFGVGTGDFNDEINLRYELIDAKLAKVDLNAHNQFLQSFATFGLAGFLLLISIFYFAFLRSRSNVHFFLFFILGTITFFSFESVLVRSRGLIFFIIVFLLLPNLSESRIEADA